MFMMLHLEMLIFKMKVQIILKHFNTSSMYFTLKTGISSLADMKCISFNCYLPAVKTSKGFYEKQLQFPGNFT